ncbi:homoserine dehydrogenase [Candidatus Margulisiibacteriota bacterium]
MSKNVVNIGIIGLGTVGSAVASILRRNSRIIQEKAGVSIVVRKAADIRSSRRKIFGVDVVSDASKVIRDPKISIIVEAIGGIFPAKKYILEAIKNKKHVVTSNKEVIAKHGEEIFKAAAKNKVSVLFEGAVGGGIPIIRSIKESLAANKISEIYGIVNGTTNYILDKMTQEGSSFNEALAEAQKKGFAEADPSIDVDGSDAAYKASILASVATDSYINPSKVYREGISKVSQEDIDYARGAGYVIKLLAVIKLSSGGEVDVRVHPTLISKNHPLANVSENNNAIYVKGDVVGKVMFYGPGAGGLPTASSVISDIIEISRGGAGKHSFNLKKAKAKNIVDIKSRYYIRLEAPDRAGVLSGISGVFAKEKVSIQTVVQKENVKDTAQIVIILHENVEKSIQKALKKIALLPMVKKISNVIRVGLD